MLRMSKCLICFLLLLVSFSFSEVVDGPANVRISPNGQKIFSLDDSSFVMVEYYENYWYYVLLNVLVENENITTGDSIFIKGNTILYNNYGLRIGKALTGFLAKNKGLKNKDYYEIFISGYTYKTNIREDFSIPKELEKILNKKWLELTESNLFPHIQKYNYESWINYLGFNTYILYSSLRYDPSPGPEILLFFYESRLFGILHIYDFNCNKIEMEKNVEGYIMSYFAKVDTSLINSFENKYFPIFKSAD